MTNGDTPNNAGGAPEVDKDRADSLKRLGRWWMLPAVNTAYVVFSVAVVGFVWQSVLSLCLMPVVWGAWWLNHKRWLDRWLDR